MSTSNPHFRQRLQRVHTVTGISVALLMYVALFFGIWAILLPYVQVWEKPSRHYPVPELSTVDYASMIEPVLADPDYPKVNGITITLPGHMEDPALRISTMFMETLVFNPNTGARVQNEGDQSELAWFLNSMHYGRPFKDAGYLLFGFVAVAVLFLVIGGLMQVVKIPYKNSGKSAANRFSLWHRRIFTWLFAPFILITLTGALMNIGYKGAAPMTYLASKGQTHEVWNLAGPVLFPPPVRIAKHNDTVEMLPINTLLEKTKEINPKLWVQKITLTNWGDSSATAKVEGYNPYMPFLNGISNKPSITFSGLDGQVLSDLRVLDKHWSGLVFDSLFFLHFLFGVDTFTRLFIAVLMVIATFGLGFGVLLWLEKQARKFPKGVPFYHWMGKLSLAVMVGVFPAVGLLFVLQWALPFDMVERVAWQKACFGVAWMATLTWAFYRVNSYQAAKEFLSLGGVLFVLSPLVHFHGSGFGPLVLWQAGMGAILSVDIGLFVLGAILLFVGWKLPQEPEKIRALWMKKTKGNR